MGYSRKKPLNILKKIISNCDNLKNSLNRLGINNKITELSGGSLKDVNFKSDTELELICRRVFDKVDVVVRIEAVVDKNGKAVLVIR